jgi:hypothetical protein
VEVQNDPVLGSRRAVVEPALDFASIEEVFVVLRLPPGAASMPARERGEGAGGSETAVSGAPGAKPARERTR